eukprot:tig00020710_g13286.t1
MNANPRPHIAQGLRCSLPSGRFGFCSIVQVPSPATAAPAARLHLLPPPTAETTGTLQPLPQEVPPVRPADADAQAGAESAAMEAGDGKDEGAAGPRGRGELEPAAGAAARAGAAGRRGAWVHVCGTAADRRGRGRGRGRGGVLEGCVGVPGGGACECAAFLFLASAASVVADACLEALNDAIDGGCDVLPVFVEQPEAALAAAPGGLDMRLRQFQWTRPIGRPGEAGYDTRIEALADALQRVARRRRPAAAPGAEGRAARALLRMGRRDEGREQEPPGPAWSRGELPADAPATRVFISYAHADAGRVRAVKDALLARGLSCWFDEMQLTAGMRWVDEGAPFSTLPLSRPHPPSPCRSPPPTLARAVRNCTHLVFFASAKSVASQYCGEEFAYAYDLERRIVVCYLEDGEAVARSASAALAMRLRRFPRCALEQDADAAAASAEAIAARIAGGADADAAHGKDATDSVALSHEAEIPNDPLLGPLVKYVRGELEGDDLATGLAAYVPPRAADRAKKQFDLHDEAAAFLRQFAPGPQPAPAAAAGGGAEAFRSAKHRVLLLLGDAGTSKTTFTRFLHREACRLWARASSRPTAPRRGELPALRRRFGLVLLLDGYDETGEKENLWKTNKIGDWASGAFVSCRTEYLASLDTAKPENLFAPVVSGDAPDVARLRQLATLPFSRGQVDEFLGKYVLLHGREEGAWPFERYAEELRRTPGLAALVENPFTLSLLARVLPSRAAESAGREGRPRALRSRELYRSFIEDWLRRELERGAPSSEKGDRPEEGALLEAGYDLCRKFAALLFRMGASQAVIMPKHAGRRGGDGGGTAKAGGPADADQLACERLLGDGSALFVRNSCPLRRWRAGGALGFAFLHKTLGEFLVAEALLDSLSGGGEELAEEDVAISFSTRSIVEEATLVRFLAEAVQHEPAMGAGDALLRLVEQSRHAAGNGDGDGAPAVLAAANAATVLVAAHFALAGRDLRGVRVPKANLWRLEAAGADLRGADMRGCSLAEACLAGADLRGARLQGCRVPQWPAMMHPDQVIAVAWLPDGRRIVSASKSVRVWDAETGAELLQLQVHTSYVNSVAVSADRDPEACGRDGRRIVSGSDDRSVRVWDAETGAELLQLQGHTGPVTSVAVSAQKRRKAGAGALSHDRDPEACGRDGRRIVSGSDDRSVRVWDAETGAELLQLQGHTKTIFSVAVSAGDVGAWRRGADATGRVGGAQDGRRIVSGSWDTSVRVWDAETGAELLQLQGHKDYVNSVAVSAGDVGAWRRGTDSTGHGGGAQDGRRIVSGSDDRSVRVWDAETGVELLNLQGHTRDVTSVAVSAQKRRRAGGGALSQHRDPEACGRDGRRIVSGSLDTSVRVWDAETGAELLQLQVHAGLIYSVAVSAQKRRRAGAGALSQHRDPEACGRDGRRIVSGSADRSVRVWDAETGAELLHLQGHTNPVFSLAVSASQDRSRYPEACGRDGRRIVSGSWDTSVRVWDAETGAELLQLQGHTYPVFSVAVSAGDVGAWRRGADSTGPGRGAQDGRRIVSGSADKSVRVWDAETGAELLHLQGHTESVYSVAVLEAKGQGRGPEPGPIDGRRIVSGSLDTSVRVWDAETGAELLHLQGHTGEIRSVAVSAQKRRKAGAWAPSQHRSRDPEACGRDGRRIVSGSADKSVRVWDAETGAELLQLQGHTHYVDSVAVSVVRRAGSQC